MTMDLEEMYTVLRGASGGEDASLTNIQRWFEECRIIDGRFISRGFFITSYERLCPNHENMTLVQFIQLLGILSRESKQGLPTFLDRFQTVKQFIIEEIRESVMEEAFRKLQENKHNSVDNLIKWMKDSKIVDGKKVTEEKARQMFADVPDASNVEFAKFQEVVSKLASERKKTVDEIHKILVDESPKFLSAAKAAATAAASAAASAFKDALTKK